MASKLFWLMVIVTLGIVAAYFKGYPNLLPAALVSLAISAVLAKDAGDASKKEVVAVRNDMHAKIFRLDNVVNDLTKSFKEQSQNNFTLGTLSTVKDELRTEFKNNIDKLAERMIDFENSMGQMKRTFSAAFASLDDRVRVIEPKQSLAPQISVEEGGYVELDKAAE